MTSVCSHLQGVLSLYIHSLRCELANNAANGSDPRVMELFRISFRRAAEIQQSSPTLSVATGSAPINSSCSARYLRTFCNFLCALDERLWIVVPRNRFRLKRDSKSREGLKVDNQAYLQQANKLGS